MGLKATYKDIKRLLYRRLYMSKQKERSIADQFHIMYYDAFLFGKTWGESHFMGTHIKKFPFDTWIYQEMLHELKPDLIIECGTYKGGNALYLASLLDFMQKGEIVTIDIVDYPDKPKHPRITYLTGSTLAPEILQVLDEKAKGKASVLVILDDDHSCDHVLKEMEIYQRYVTPGNYMIVEDSNVNGHPVFPEHGPGPYEAIEKFMRSNDAFIIDKDRERYYMTANPNGYLRKK